MRPEEKKYILENFEKKSAQEMAKTLNIRERKVRKFLDLYKKKHKPTHVKPASEPREEKKKDINKIALFVSILLIIAMGFVAYTNSLGGKFLWDDNNLIKTNPYISKWSYATKAFTENINAGQGEATLSYRPIQMIIYIAANQLWGKNVFGYHMLSLVSHILVTLCVFWLINILFHNLKLSLMASLLYIVCPIHTSAVAYMSGLADPLAALFMLFALILYVRNLKINSVMLSLLIGISYLCAILSKEYTLILIAVVFLYHFIFNKKIEPLHLAPIICVTVIYAVFRMTFLTKLLPHTIYTTTMIQRFPGFLIALTTYVRLLFLPINLHVEYGQRLFSMSDPRAILGLFILIGILWAAIAFIKKSKLVSFSLFWFLVTLLPQSNLYPIHYYMAEHWLYIPSIGFFMLVAGGILYLYKKGKLRILALSILIGWVTLYSYLTIEQNHYWSEPLTFFLRSIKYSPNNPVLYNDCGNVYMELGKKKEAIKLYRKAIKLAPNQLHTYINMAIGLKDIGRKKEAIHILKRLIAVKPDYYKAYNSLGSLYKETGKNEKALAMFKKTIALRPDYSEAYNNIAIVYEIMGKFDEAIDFFKKAIELFPNQFPLYYNLGAAYIGAKKYDEALATLNHALTLNPGSKEIYNNMGNAYYKMGKPDEAVRAYRKALEIDPKYFVIYKNIAVIYYYEKKYDLAIESYDKAISLGMNHDLALLNALEQFRKKEKKP